MTASGELDLERGLSRRSERHPWQKEQRGRELLTQELRELNHRHAKDAPAEGSPGAARHSAEASARAAADRAKAPHAAHIPDFTSLEGVGESALADLRRDRLAALLFGDLGGDALVGLEQAGEHGLPRG